MMLATLPLILLGVPPRQRNVQLICYYATANHTVNGVPPFGAWSVREPTDALGQAIEEEEVKRTVKLECMYIAFVISS